MDHKQLPQIFALEWSHRYEFAANDYSSRLTSCMKTPDANN